MIWHLFLDDERTPYPNALYNRQRYTIARSSREALQLVLDNGMPLSMQLDHDLGMHAGAPDTTMDFLKGLSELLSSGEISFPKGFTYNIHSQNPVGVQNIAGYMQNLLRHFS